MTGWRIGWLLVPDGLLDSVDRLAGNFTICPPTLSQHAAVAAFDAYDELDANVAHYAENRALLVSALPSIGLDSFAPPDGAFYIYADVTRWTDDAHGVVRAAARRHRGRDRPRSRLRPGRRRPVRPDDLRRSARRSRARRAALGGGWPVADRSASARRAVRRLDGLEDLDLVADADLRAGVSGTRWTPNQVTPSQRRCRASVRIGSLLVVAVSGSIERHHAPVAALDHPERARRRCGAAANRPRPTPARRRRPRWAGTGSSARGPPSARSPAATSVVERVQ